MNAPQFKEIAHQLVDNLSDKASWDELIQSIYVQQAVEAGLADCEAGRVVDVATLRERFGLEP